MRFFMTVYSPCTLPHNYYLYGKKHWSFTVGAKNAFNHKGSKLIAMFFFPDHSHTQRERDDCWAFF